PIAPGEGKGFDKEPGPKDKPTPRLPVEQERDRLVRAITQADTRTVQLEHNVTLDESVVFDGAGQTLEIESKEHADPRTLRLIYKGQDAWAGLVVKRGQVKIRNLKIEIESSAGSSPHTPVAA